MEDSTGHWTWETGCRTPQAGGLVDATGGDNTGGRLRDGGLRDGLMELGRGGAGGADATGLQSRLGWRGAGRGILGSAHLGR